jgi:GT2 family glycosyltransferase
MISVILATHNGADTIDRTLAAMRELDAPAGGWKLVVVNNASTDSTESRVLAWQACLPLEYLVEPRLGKSKAINTAFRHAEGDFIVMTDDDVLPDRNWLTEWRRVADAYPDYSIFGGAVIPEFGASPPPAYVPDHCYGTLYGATHRFAEGPLQPSPDTGLFDVAGANIAIRKSVYDNGHRFDEGLSVGTDGLMGEDTEFVRRLGTAGHKVGFAPGARVRHIIHKHQTSWGWIHRRFVRNGRAAFMLLHVRRDGASGRPIFRFPHRRIGTAAGSFLRLLLASAGLNWNGAFKQSRALAFDLGTIRQALALSWRRGTEPRHNGHAT